MVACRYDWLSLEELDMEKLVLPNGQTGREFLIARPSGYIKTVGNLNHALLSEGLRTLTEDEIASARKPRLVDANAVDEVLRDAELSMSDGWEAMRRARMLVEKVPTAFDKQTVEKQIGNLMPSIETEENRRLCDAVKQSLRFVEKGGIDKKDSH